MNLRYAPRFVSSFKRLSAADKIAVIHAIELFQESPHDESLHNHDLVGMMAGRRAFAAAPDLRIVFSERGNYEDVTLLHVGGHSEVYRR
jgi:mRNA-degrading endonuclease YafQ of YafQ-DinJ toxin-antitoxin module